MEFTQMWHYELTRRLQVKISKTNKQNFNNFLPKKHYFKKKKFFRFWGENKSLFLNPFLHFFQQKKIKLSSRKIVQINMFPIGIKNSTTISKKKGQAHFAKKGVNMGKKGGTFLAKLHFWTRFYIFSKN